MKLRNLATIFDIEEPHNPNTDFALEAIMDGDNSYYHEIELLYEEFKSIPNIRNLDKGSIELYRFTGLPTKKDKNGIDKTKFIIEDIKNEALTFSDPNGFNDPMDPIIKEWIKRNIDNSSSSLEKQYFKRLKNSLLNLRMCCLSEESRHRQGCARTSIINNPLMWAHYADKHKGICIKYEITNKVINSYNDDNQVLRINRVRYRGAKAMSGYITIDNALIAKGTPWKDENEIRLILYRKNSISEARNPNNKYVSLPGFKIKAVYMGYRINQRDKNDVINAARLKQIPVFQVYFPDYDITKLINERVII